jgi:hypothetical protein
MRKNLGVINLYAAIQPGINLGQSESRHALDASSSQRQNNNDMLASLDDTIDPLRNKIAQNTKRNKTSGDGEEPIQVIDILTRYDTV